MESGNWCKSQMSCHMQQSWFTERHLTNWVTKNSCAVSTCQYMWPIIVQIICVLRPNICVSCTEILSSFDQRIFADWRKSALHSDSKLQLLAQLLPPIKLFLEASVCADIVLVFNIKLLNSIPYSFPEHVNLSRCNCKCQLVTYCSYVCMSSASHLKPMT